MIELNIIKFFSSLMVGGDLVVFGLLPFSVGPWELILILVIVLIIVGPGKLPSVGRSIGKAINEFRSSRNGLDEQKELKEEPGDFSK